MLIIEELRVANSAKDTQATALIAFTPNTHVPFSGTAYRGDLNKSSGKGCDNKGKRKDNRHCNNANTGHCFMPTDACKMHP
jgi:hypothetical protein